MKKIKSLHEMKQKFQNLVCGALIMRFLNTAILFIFLFIKSDIMELLLVTYTI